MCDLKKFEQVKGQKKKRMRFNLAFSQWRLECQSPAWKFNGQVFKLSEAENSINNSPVYWGSVAGQQTDEGAEI